MKKKKKMKQIKKLYIYNHVTKSGHTHVGEEFYSSSILFYSILIMINIKK